jgi:hypothetical protein
MADGTISIGRSFLPSGLAAAAHRRTGERRTLRMVAQYADACNLFDIPDGGATVRRQLSVLGQHCADVGRPADQIERPSAPACTRRTAIAIRRTRLLGKLASTGRCHHARNAGTDEAIATLGIAADQLRAARGRRRRSRAVRSVDAPAGARAARTGAAHARPGRCRPAARADAHRHVGRPCREALWFKHAPPYGGTRPTWLILLAVNRERNDTDRAGQACRHLGLTLIHHLIGQRTRWLPVPATRRTGAHTIAHRAGDELFVRLRDAAMRSTAGYVSESSDHDCVAYSPLRDNLVSTGPLATSDPPVRMPPQHPPEPG